MRAKFIPVKIRLLDDECFLCSENTRYSFIRNTVWVTMYTMYRVNRQFMMYEAGLAQSIRLSTLIYSKGEMKVLTSAMKISTETSVVTTKSTI